MSKIVFLLYKVQVILLRLKLRYIAYIFLYFIRVVFSAWIPGSAKIGKGTKFGYGGLGVVIHDRAVIGEHCLIDQNVTIGGTSKKFDVPKLGNRVYVGAGAKILGPVSIGSNVVIGANSVVINSIPDNSLVVGSPGRVIKSDIKMSSYV